jgi:cell wall-associated NlpC family hydrolase
VSHVRASGLRTRAAGLLLACVALAAGTTFAQSGGKVPLDGAPDQAAADVLHVARNQLGDPYVWGGNGPDGWDCSGFTSLWRSVGGARDMPRVSRDQQTWAVPIPQEQALRGDLVFFGHPVTHVGIVSGGGYMLDAGASRSAVVSRRIWSTGVVRYGRVPRPGMPKVRPWTPPPLPSPLPAAPIADSPQAAAAAEPRTTRPAAPKPAPKPVGKPGKPTTKPGKPTTKPSKPAAKPAKPAAKPVKKPVTSGTTPLKGLPGVQKAKSSPLALKAAANARSAAGRPAGSKGWNDVSLVATAWKHAGGKALPADRNALVARGKAVPLADARVGDLVVYGSPATHLGVYLGHGYMVDASNTFGRVVVRRVYASASVRLVRLG